VPNVDGEDEPPFIVVLDDAALGFRDDRQVWPAALLSTDSRENLPAWILLKMAKPIAQGPLWEHLVTHFADRLIVTLAINDLRLMNVQVSRDVSWERTAEDLAWELLNNPLVNSLSQCAHVVVSFYTAGAFLLSGGLGRPRMGNTAPRAELLFDPLLVDVPGDKARRRTSVPLGSIHSMKKAEARRKLRTMLEEMGLNGEQHLEHTSLGGKTFNTEAAWWREQKLSKYKPSCQETMAGHLDKYLIPQLGSLPMAAIDERRVQELITEMERVEYTRSDGVKKRLSPKSICNVIGVLKLMLGKKVWRDWNLVFPENIDPDKERRYFTQAEMIQVVNAAEGQWKVLFALMAGSGLRTGEVSGLEIEDLDLEAGLIRVRRGIWKGRAITPKTKRGKRTVFIEPTLVSMLCSYLEGRTSGRVFQTASGKPHSRHNVWRKLKLILKSLGLQPGGLHAFRHGRVSMLQANGMPGDLLLEQVGHSNLKTTSGYTHFDDAFRQRMARVQGLFSQEDGPNGPKFPDFPSTGRVM
jgi:integrase